MIKTNAKEVWDEFESLELKEMKKALTSGLRSAAGILRKDVRKSLKSVVPSAYKKNPKYNDTLAAGVRITKVKEKKNFFYVYTTIASNRKVGSGSFRLHFLEAGTNIRSTRKGYNRGKIKPLNFFQTALSSFRLEPILQEEVDKAVSKINKTRISKPL